MAVCSQHLLCAAGAPPRGAPVLAAPRRPVQRRTGAGGGSCLGSRGPISHALLMPAYAHLQSTQSKETVQDQGSARELDAQGLLQSVLQQPQVLADLRAFRIQKVRSEMGPPRTEPPSLGRCALVPGAQRTPPATRPPSPAQDERFAAWL